MQSIIRFFPKNRCERASELLYQWAEMGGIENSAGKLAVSPEQCIFAAQRFNDAAEKNGEYFNSVIKTPSFTYEERDAIFGLVS
jgi:hypothetical protein